MTPSTRGAGGTTAFASVARAAIEKHVPEARTGAATWHPGAGSVWVLWPREEGGWAALGLRRHLDWVTGEAARGRGSVDPESLPLTTDTEELPASGYRIRLGVLLHDEDRWWPAGASASELRERLEWLALQLRARSESHFARHPLSR
jgi:hypothetical protein